MRNAVIDRAKGVMGVLRRALVAGSLALAPLGITIWVFVELIGLADSVIGLLPEPIQPKNLLGFEIPGLGVLLTLGVVVLFGVTLRYYLGRRIVEVYEAVLRKVPILNGIYQGLKELIGTLFSNNGKHFRKVVLVEYPRKGVYCLAFLTNELTCIRLQEESEQDALVSVFLPTTPNPTSGFYLMLSRSDVQMIDMGVDEAFKLIMSAGIVKPTGDREPKPFEALQGRGVDDVDEEHGLGG